MVVRAAFAVLLLAGLGGAIWWSVAHAPPDRPSGSWDVYVVGPSSLLYNGTVEVQDADALSVLKVLAQRDAFDLDVDDLPGCSYDYVRGVAGYRETGTGGWNFYVRADGADDWAWQDQAASCGGLHAGDDVLWCWVEPDERCAVYP